LHLAKQLEPGVARHLEVRDDELWSPLLGHDSPGLFRIVDEHRLEALSSYDVTIEIHCLRAVPVMSA
jgi:hypothetical protein